MRLAAIMVQNYRSIVNSEPISISRVTALIGQNESGKSNLLQGIYLLNPDSEPRNLEKSTSYPRHLNFDLCSDSTLVVNSRWELSGDDKKKLADIWPAVKSLTLVEVQRDYAGMLYVTFVDQRPLNRMLPLKKIRSLTKKSVTDLYNLPYELTDASVDSWESVYQKFANSMTVTENYEEWAMNALVAIADLRHSLAGARLAFEKNEDSHLETLKDCINNFLEEVSRRANARSWVRDNMPKFVLLDVFPQIPGRVNVSQYLSRISSNTGTQADVHFGKMCKVAGLDLISLVNQKQPRARRRILYEASKKLTREIQNLWIERRLKVQLDLDGDDFTTSISEPSGYHDIDIELDERSLGFRWFFSFFISFAADTMDEGTSNAIILLDEPGLHLHARSQQNLLRIIERRFRNQAIYTTHLPFMVPTNNLNSIKVVTYHRRKGTIVSNDATGRGDSKTLFPLQAALGYDITQSLFIGKNNLVVEGVTDYWVLFSISKYLSRIGKTHLRDDITIMPVGGAHKVCSMVALLSSQRLNILVLLDHEIEAKKERDRITKTMLLNQDKIIFVSEGFEGEAPSESDIEDLIGEDVYEKLVLESHSKELTDNKLKHVSKAPRITKRFEDDFRKIGAKFDKVQPMRLLSQKLNEGGEGILTPEIENRFSRLFEKINSLMKV